MTPTKGTGAQTSAAHDTDDHSTTTQQVAGKVKQEGERLAAKATEEGGRLATKAKQAAEGMAEQRKGEAADYLKDLSGAIRSGSESLNDSGRSQAASLVSRAAEELEGIATSLDGKQSGEILKDAEQIARQNPTLFFGAAMLAGFGIVRFLKSSADNGANGGANSHGDARTSGPQPAAQMAGQSASGGR